MWFSRARQALDEEKPRPLEATHEGGDFYETLGSQTMDLKPRGLGDSVLDLRPTEEREPKPISHYHEGNGEIFYDVLPIVQRPSITERVRGVEWAEVSELVGLIAALAVTVLVGVGLIYAALR